MDWASVAGLVLALAGLMLGHTLEGGRFASLIQPAAFAIVVVGTFGAVLLQTEIQTFMRGMRMLRWVFRPPESQRARLARDIAQWSLHARRDGLLSLADYQDMLSDGGGHQLVYYEDFHDSEGNDSFLDRYAVDDADPLRSLMDGDFRQAVIDAIDALPPREKILMGLYYEEELNLKEIGAVMGVSESRVSQLHTQAVARLRATLREQAWTGPA